MILETAALILALLALAYSVWASKFDYWQKRRVPHIPGKVPFGSIAPMIVGRENSSDFFERLYKSHENAPLVGFYGPLGPALMVRDPDLVKSVLSSFKHFGNARMIATEDDPIFRNNPFMIPHYDEWKFKRGILSQLFTLINVKTGVRQIHATCNLMLKYIEEKHQETLEAESLVRKFAIDAMVLYAMNLNSDSFFNIDAFPYKTDEWFANSGNFVFMSTIFCPFLGRLLKSKLLRYEKCISLSDTIKSLMGKRRSNARADFIKRLIDVNEKLTQNGKPALTDVEMTGLAFSFLLDGVETLSHAAVNILYEMATHSTIQEKLRNEIKSFFGSVDDIDGETLNSMPFLEQCVREGLRLHTVVPILIKVCTEETQLGDLLIPKGMLLFLPVEQLQLNEKHYADPLTFNPDRWLSQNDKNVWFPFGGGPRTCLGEKYATMMLKLILCSILLKFRMSSTCKYEKVNFFFTLNAAKPVHIKFDPL